MGVFAMSADLESNVREDLTFKTNVWKLGFFEDILNIDLDRFLVDT